MLAADDLDADGQAVGGEPVDPDKATRAVAPQQDLAEILELGQVRRPEMADAGGCDLGILRAGEMQELVDLMRGDIGEDAAEIPPVEEPVRPDRPVGWQ